MFIHPEEMAQSPGSLCWVNELLAPWDSSRNDTFQGMFTTYEAVLNTCSLTYIISDQNDLEPLTPEHFLAKKDHIALADIRGQTFSWEKYWHHLQSILDHVWRRYCSEYLPSLLPRSMWLNAWRDFKVGDVQCCAKVIGHSSEGRKTG